MTTLRTATGKEFYCDFMGTANELVLYVKVDGDLHEILNTFQNPEETRILQHLTENGEVTREETMFTKFVEIHLMSDGCPIRIRMEKDLDTLIRQKAQEMLDNKNQEETE